MIDPIDLRAAGWHPTDSPNLWTHHDFRGVWSTSAARELVMRLAAPIDIVEAHATLRELVRAFIVTHAGHCDQCDAYATQIADGCCYACDAHTGWCGAGCGAEPHARPCPAWTDLPHAALIRAVMSAPTLPSRPR